MKSRYILGLLMGLFVLVGCEDSEDPVGLRDVGVVTSLSDINPAIFVFGELDDSYVNFVVAKEEGVTVDEAYIVGSHNGTSQRTKIKGISSFPAEVNISAVEVAQALGLEIAEIKSGDFFVLEVITVSDGLLSRSAGSLRVRVVCSFDPAVSFGAYTAASSDWKVNGGITLTPDEEDPFTIYVSGLAALDDEVTEDLGPLVMKIDPLSFNVVAEKSILATAFDKYTGFSYAGSGTFDSCTGTYQMLMSISVDQGSFGSFEFTFTKN